MSKYVILVFLVPTALQADILPQSCGYFVRPFLRNLEVFCEEPLASESCAKWEDVGASSDPLNRTMAVLRLKLDSGSRQSVRCSSRILRTTCDDTPYIDQACDLAVELVNGRFDARRETGWFFTAKTLGPNGPQRLSDNMNVTFLDSKFVAVGDNCSLAREEQEAIGSWKAHIYDQNSPPYHDRKISPQPLQLNLFEGLGSNKIRKYQRLDSNDYYIRMTNHTILNCYKMPGYNMYTYVWARLSIDFLFYWPVRHVPK